MTNVIKALKFQLVLLVALVFIAFISIVATIYLFAVKDTSKSYSLKQSWKEYYNLEDWNLPMHAIADIDNDDKRDMVTFTNCAFLSSVPAEKISFDKQCREPSMSIIAFSDNTTFIGQKLISQKPFRYKWLRKSYLVKTHDDIWKFYDMNGLQLRIYELGKDHLFTEVKPTFLDMFDAFTYQIGHLGIVLLLIVLPK